MAYADTIRTAQATLTDAATLIDQLIVGTESASLSGSVSSTSSSVVDLPSANFTTTLVSGQSIFLFAHGCMSHSAANGTGDFRLYRNSTAIGLFCTARNVVASDTAGDKHQWVLGTIDAPGAGSYTYKVTYGTGSGTVYVNMRTLIGLKIRVS